MNMNLINMIININFFKKNIGQNLNNNVMKIHNKIRIWL